MLLTQRRRLLDREPFILKDYARQATALLAHCDADLVFCPSTLPIAYLECRQPIFFWTDATFAGNLGFYINRATVTDSSVRDGHTVEKQALDRCRLAIYASEWAAESAIDNYAVSPNKVKVVPFGANLQCSRTYDQIREMVDKRPRDLCRLLFVGVDWARKGGDIALAVAQRLNDEGMRATLTVAGCEPKIRGALPRFINLVGFLDKTTLAGRARLEDLYAQSHFLILPSRAEAYGLVLAEACSFGLPCIASSVGGIPTIVHDGANGRTFSSDSDISDYCSYIRGLMEHRAEYEELCYSSFNEYERRLNWRVAGEKVRRLIDEYR